MTKKTERLIAQLTYERDNARRELQESLDKDTPSCIWTEAPMSNRKHYIQSDRLRIKTIKALFDVEVDGDKIVVRVVHSLSTQITIIPVVANVIHIKAA